MAQRQLLRDRPAHRDSENVRRRKPEVIHQRRRIVRQHRDAVRHVGLVAQPRAALVEPEYAIPI